MKTLFDLTREIAEAQSIASPQPPLFDVVFSIYEELGGSNNPTTIYDTLQAMLDEGLVSGGGITPSGSLEILENGEYDVTHYASASVNVPQGVFPSGNLSITQNGNYEVAGYESASVSVQGGGGNLDLNTGIKFGNSTFSSLPTDILNANWSECTSSLELFADCRNLVSMSYVDTSNVTLFTSMFRGCQNLVYVPLLNTSKGTEFNVMFRDCKKLVTIPAFNLSSATRIDYMFYGCTNLVSVPSLDTSNVTNISNVFHGCTSLQSIGKLNFSKVNTIITSGDFSNCPALENVGGFTGLKRSIPLQTSSKLTLQSVINILTEAADLTGQTGATLTLHADAKARLTQAEYDLAASKNWTIA